MSLSLLWAGTPVDVDDTVVTTQLPEQFSDQVKEVAARLMQLCDAETMEQHQMAVANLSQDVTLSTSLFTFTGNDAVRVGMYRTKFFASLEAKPILAEVNTSDTTELTILYLMQVDLLPKRTWINPIGFVLPWHVPYTYIVKVNVGSRKRVSDITAIDARILNHKQAPAWLRALNGYAWATSALVLEPVWSKCVHWLGDDSYVKRGKAI